MSPDGATVVFENWGRLYTVDAAGQQKREIVTGLGDQNFTPRWSPDGKWILFQGPDSVARTNQVFRIRPDGSGLKRLTEPSAGGASGGAWSPDGSEIIVVRYAETDCFCPYTFWVTRIDLATGTESTLVDSTVGFNGYDPSWSPDGKSVLFLASGQGWGIQGWVIARLDLLTGAYDALGGAQGNRRATWSPDGSTLLFGTGDLWLMDADGQNQRPLLADGMYNFEAFWTPATPTR